MRGVKKLYLKTILLLLVFSPCKYFAAEGKQKTFIIIVHGTFASKCAWHTEKGLFCQQIKKYCEKSNMDISLQSFIWSGALSSTSRLDGAINFAKKIIAIKNEDPDCKIVCIGHSHGGNIILMGSQMVYMSKSSGINFFDSTSCKSLVWSLICQEDLFPKEKEEDSRSIESDSDPLLETISTVSEIELSAHMIREFLTRGGTNNKPCKIDQVYLIATPINTKIYGPSSESIGEIYSFYSTADLVQIYSPVYKRRLADFSPVADYLPTKVFEFQVELFDSQKDKVGRGPGHLDMNDNWMGYGLLSIPLSVQTLLDNPETKSDGRHFKAKFLKDCSAPPAISIW